ncbi:MAG: hypothetical protein ACE10K_06015 [Rhodothermales bacterium]
MESMKFNQIDAYWDGLVERMQQLKELDLANEAQLQQALDESQRLLGAIAHCRHLLTQVEPRSEELHLHAA